MYQQAVKVHVITKSYTAISPRSSPKFPAVPRLDVSRLRIRADYCGPIAGFREVMDVYGTNHVWC